jgi:predicted SprT family Zn-dependent metalloprotease
VTLAEFESRLARYLDHPLQYRVTQNRSTMLRLLIGKKLSLHEMFLKAPDDILAAIAAYVKNPFASRKSLHNQQLRDYIHAHLDTYVDSAKERPLVVRNQGRVYNLQALMESIHKEYFSGELELVITWFKSRGARRRILFGKYEQDRRLIKINDYLDKSSVPEYFVRFVIYHEMVHHIVPGVMKRCRRSVHGAEFKQVERQFREYDKARLWERKNGWA